MSIAAVAPTVVQVQVVAPSPPAPPPPADTTPDAPPASSVYTAIADASASTIRGTNVNVVA